MTGVVLCGGQGSRMGKDKGLLQYQSATWAQNAFSLLSSLHIPVVCSVRQEQVTEYERLFEQTVLVKDDNALMIGGPLKGILSVHLQHTAEDLLVLACDMPLMQADVLRYLIDNAREESAEASVFESSTGIEPLCGIYTSKGLNKILSLHSSGELKKHSIMHVLENIATNYLPLPSEWEKYFRNYNTPADLNNQ